MKKYVKPELFFEQFVLSQHIADCKLEYVDATNEMTCYAIPDYDNFDPSNPNKVFLSKGICEYDPPEGYCYTGSAEGINTFAS